ncbi:hypothetical protein FD06_GL000501 [Apilactobacillus ozensis DSM 23829 = JCM 17196]|uniref:HTH cro/C1-type domain-containing protein n=2 Tax=Apilactobacillus ozensis TaxID=866801 RepID=A0A0R2AM94_9LACO|nr:hypothetical protein FD06_GL000501 [Apilactobacillus ozensis DSM 23829 = JCM 17196]
MQLCKGICTQPNISTIEKNGSCPSISTVSSICKKLDISIDEVVNGSENNFNHSEDVDNYIFSNQWLKASDYLQNVNYDLIDSKTNRIKYNYCNGYLQFHLHKDLNQAMFFYNQVIRLCKNIPNNVYSIGASVGILEIYLVQKQLDVRHLLSQINSLSYDLSKIDFDEHNGKFLTLLYSKIIENYQLLGMYEESLRFYGSVISNIKRNFVAFKLCELKNLKAISLFKLDNNIEAFKHLKFALDLGSFYKNDMSVAISKKLYIQFKKGTLEEI